MGISEEDYAALCGPYLHNASCNNVECTPHCPLTVLTTTLLIANGGSAFRTPRWKAGTLYCQTGTLDRSRAVTPIPVTVGEDNYFSSTLHHDGCQPWVCAYGCPLRTLAAALHKNIEDGHAFNEPGVMSRADNYVKLGVINVNEIPDQACPVHTPLPSSAGISPQFVAYRVQQPSAMPYIGYPLQKAPQISGYNCSSPVGLQAGHIITSPLPSAVAVLSPLINKPAEIYRVFNSYPEFMRPALSEEVRKQTGFHLRLDKKGVKKERKSSQNGSR